MPQCSLVEGQSYVGMHDIGMRDYQDVTFHGFFPHLSSPITISLLVTPFASDLWMHQPTRRVNSCLAMVAKFPAASTC